jgi:glycosyltransferase involved in cell wall biosynthesis
MSTYRHAVIVSSYNRPTMVREALQSIMFQRANVQVIVADDDSNEETRHAIETEIRGRPSYRAIYANRPREGEFANITRRATQCINDALALIDAELVHYLPDDDWYGSGRFFAFERFFDAHPDADVAYGRMYTVATVDGELCVVDDLFRGVVLTDPVNWVDHGQFCHRARVLERVPRWPATPHYAFDANFLLALAKAGYDLHPVNHVVNYKSKHDRNLMSEGVRRFVEEHLTQLAGQLHIADIGAYDVNGNLRGLFQRPEWSYTGFDLSSGPNVDVVLPSAHNWPNVATANFDVVVSVSTLEHTLRPWLVVQEIARILVPGGLVCLTAPYAWPYHAHPIDCWRIYPDAMETIMKDAGIDVISTKMVGAGSWIGDTVGIGRRTGGGP